MPTLVIKYDDKSYGLNLEKVSVDELEEIEEYTGLPGNSWTDQLWPTDWNGKKIDGDRPEYQVRFNPSTRVVRVMYWLMLRQANQDPGPIPTVKPSYVELVTAYVLAFAEQIKDIKDQMKAAEVEEAPKASTIEPLSEPDVSRSAPINQSFT